ncbi:GIY-YIG nuclease family protein [Aequorivita vladivostokensis]|uniref:GIY-YIG nuclease family protein n=1 Tax=Aequorivita vladivostokensis TaxID=171194 RepID=UPI000A00669A|nr:GIY-YIG nuclease family protein [Aequorivita vladivostokensis]MAB56895.1 excinuclease ABC subunit C [Aequorivita sp.]MBF30934.1 excinuclease ABC subunit C [Aequorivita sp.]|tara:strand:- start:26912 stop:27187 length:276 start_codon:yes stop_codon:yes gene_type:complete
MKNWYVYIMSNKPKGVIYIGITDNIDARVEEHKNKVFRNSFTAKYNCDKLVYYEEFKEGFKASQREKQFDLSVNWNNENLIYKTNRFPIRE